MKENGEKFAENLGIFQGFIIIKQEENNMSSMTIHTTKDKMKKQQQ